MLERRTLREKWMRLHIRVLLMAIKGYRTMSHEAVRVVAGVVPIDIKVREKLDVMESRRNRNGETGRWMREEEVEIER